MQAVSQNIKFKIVDIYNTGCGDWKEYNGHCYKRFYNNINWSEAFKRCLDKDSHLVTIFLQLYNNNFLGDEIWIGYVQNNTAGEPDKGWYWITKENKVFLMWQNNVSTNIILLL